MNYNTASKRLTTFALICAASAPAIIPTAYAEQDDFFDLPLEDLMNIEVTSVSKQSEKASEAAAAIYVITQEDIRRSGLTTVPELLRMAPGVQVAQIDSNKWAITSRGFNRQFSNKLLVLIDGRSVYTPSFSGVFWDAQDLILKDIDRIEVIRGPGATLWGANAVNGVINIITKTADKTQGSYVAARYGNYERGTLEARHGAELGDGGHIRLYGKHRRFDEYENVLGLDANDDWSMSQAGFRWDSTNNTKNDFTIQGDIYYGDKDQSAISYPSSTSPLGFTARTVDENFSGGNILTRWTQEQSAQSETTLQAYFDLTHRSRSPLTETVATADLDFHHNYQINERNNLVWGLGYRHITTNFKSSELVVYDRNTYQDDIISGFIQNKFTLIPNELYLTAGSKFEHNDLSGYEYQPSARVSWEIDDKKTAWASVSRSVRTPSQNEAYNDFIVSSLPPNSLLGPGTPASQITWVGDRSVNAENMMAYEIGYRTQLTNNSSLDFSAFYNDYHDLRTFDNTAGPVVDVRSGQPFFVLPHLISNNSDAETYGFEVAGNWQVSNKWRLTGNYSFIRIHIHSKGNASPLFTETEEGTTPQHMFNIHSLYNITENIEWDNAVYYADNLSAAGVSNYTRFDTRISWKPRENLRLTLVGQNLFDEHQEFNESLYGVASEIGRSIYGQVGITF